MRQLILNIQDSDMRALKRVARDKETRPEQLVKDQLKVLVASDRRVRIVRYVRLCLGSDNITKTAYALRLAPAVGMHYAIETEDTQTAHQLEHATSLHAAGRQPAQTTPTDATAKERARRHLLLSQTAGMWKKQKEPRADGVQYQAEARAEWD